MIILAILSTFIVGDAKSQLAEAHFQVEKAQDKSLAKVQLAKALWQDQNQESSFRIYLEAIEEAKPSRLDNSNEQAIYEEALALYLTAKPEDVKEVSRSLISKYGKLANAHPEYNRLNFVVALSEANLSEFECFYDRFYRSYLKLPDHYLAYKTLAILHIKLFEREKDLNIKEQQRQEILKNLALAEKGFPNDIGLKRLQIYWAKPGERELAVREILNKILSLSMIPSRADTLYFVQLAKALGDAELLTKWIKNGLEWYPDSRSLKQIEKDGIKNAR